MRRCLLILVALCFLFGGGTAMAEFSLPPAPPVTSPGHRRCGTEELFGHRFPIEAQGVGCREARGLLSRPCRAYLHGRWSCSSYRESSPFVLWSPTADLFKRAKHPAVLLRRYPCSEAKVTPSLFGHPSKGLPTRRQLLADDVLRCGLLEPGDPATTVEATIGPPEVREPSRAGSEWIYYLGPERDSIIQIDPELLDVVIEHGHLTSVEIVQGG